MRTPSYLVHKLTKRADDYRAAGNYSYAPGDAAMDRDAAKLINDMGDALSSVLDAWSFISEGPQPEPMRHAMRRVRTALEKARGT